MRGTQPSLAARTPPVLNVGSGWGGEDFAHRVTAVFWRAFSFFNREFFSPGFTLKDCQVCAVTPFSKLFGYEEDEPEKEEVVPPRPSGEAAAVEQRVCDPQAKKNNTAGGEAEDLAKTAEKTAEDIAARTVETNNAAMILFSYMRKDVPVAVKLQHAERLARQLTEKDVHKMCKYRYTCYYWETRMPEDLPALILELFVPPNSKKTCNQDACINVRHWAPPEVAASRETTTTTGSCE